MGKPAYADDRRYTDRDVRESQGELVQVAAQFLSRYGGDFEFLTDAQNAYFAGNLTVPLARGVLNCMRSDPLGAQMLPARVSVPAVPAPKLRIVREERPAIIDLPSVWHRPYVMSVHRMAVYVHILDGKRSVIRWYPHRGEFRCMPYPLCSQRLPDPALLRMEFSVPPGRLLCRRCEEKR